MIKLKKFIALEKKTNKEKRKEYTTRINFISRRQNKKGNEENFRFFFLIFFYKVQHKISIKHNIESLFLCFLIVFKIPIQKSSSPTL